ncbi:MAG: hypothetical protein NZ773_16115 [Dehalococcoidia bacterium]|nr:hypothetical protein [Dehalococcoidia bacterium]
MTPHEFLDQLWAEKPSDLYLLIWTLEDKRSRWFQKVEEAAAAVTQTPQDVYVGVGLSPRDYGPSRRCPSDEIAGIAGLWADFDLQSEAHKKTLPATIPDALSIIPAGIPPTIVVATGNGAHAWWLFKEPWIFDDTAERERASCLVQRWHTLLQENAQRRSWTFDRLSDLARVLRIPGTINGKDPSQPKPVMLHSNAGRRYNPSDFEDLLSGIVVRVPSPRQPLVAAQNALAVNPNATVPQELLDGWMAQDMRFRNTWLRQRHDLKDQSQSGYDLALAGFGVEAGLTDQEIVDLLIHHRRTHGQRQRTRLDYFERTIAKARATAEAAAANIAVPMPDAGEDATDRRRLLLDELSKLFGVSIQQIRKITGKDPTYQMVVEGETLEFASVGKLIDQRFLRLTLAAGLDRLIPKIKPKDWERVAQMLLDSLTVTDGGEENDLRGAARLYLDHYLSETSFIDSIAGQPVQSLRKPTIYDGHIAICTSDLQPHINKVFGHNLSLKAVASMLAAVGAANTRIRGSQFRDQSRWLLPQDEFPPSRYLAAEQKEEEHAARA